jgi:hypothetical protein
MVRPMTLLPAMVLMPLALLITRSFSSVEFLGCLAQSLSGGLVYGSAGRKIALS